VDEVGKALDGISRSIQRLRTISEEDMPPCLAISELDLIELRLCKLRTVLSTAEAIDLIVSRLNLDNIDPNTLTLGELRRAV
jgi:hypothetical protein